MYNKHSHAYYLAFVYLFENVASWAWNKLALVQLDGVDQINGIIGDRCIRDSLWVMAAEAVMEVMVMQPLVKRMLEEAEEAKEVQ